MGLFDMFKKKKKDDTPYESILDPAAEDITAEEEAEPESIEENEDASYYEEQMKQSQPSVPDVDTSDQVKMIKELFGGKVI